ncbi:YqcC family protein [Mucilaginibacter sp.]|uniref:YqcC family protein n=1 Tax=Mucilaginibacter sp. TaxID=1882438 RepID=UPI0035BC7A4A
MAESKFNLKDKIVFLFFPLSFRRMYAQSAGALLAIIILFVWSNMSIRGQLQRKPISGKITDIKTGSKGGYASGKYSGASSYYHIQIAGYRRNFLLEDASVFENWQFNANDFKIGDIAAFRIMAADKPNLQKPTEYRMQRNISWPQEASSTKIYGLTINGKKVLSIGSTVRGQSYNRWFWLMVPLLIYATLNVFMKTGFRNWTKKEEDKDLNKMISDMQNNELYKSVEAKTLSIENELIKLGEWRPVPPDPAVFVDMGAFGSNTMPFTTWLQFVFIPNVKKIISTKGVFPESSSVATYAYRNLEEERYDRLNALLSEFDSLFNKS